jgi:hypothetical protein
MLIQHLIYTAKTRLGKLVGFIVFLLVPVVMVLCVAM